ncbi:MAG TPA: alanine racemase [Marmoricola sp.]
MSLTLYVDGGRWRDHLRSVAAERPGLVPVAKGNGYGFGLHRLARRAAWLGADTIAVGTYDEIPAVADRFAGDIVVLTPWRPFLDTSAAEALADRIVHTVGRPEDLEALAATGSSPRVVLEMLSSMRRHGFDAGDLTEAITARGIRHEGVALHLPLPGAASVAEAQRLLAARDDTTVWVSHLSTADVSALAAAHPRARIRPRVGTDLWLGDRGALSVRTRVLDAHPILRGERYGYRQRRAPRSGTLLVVSGGTAHGIGLEAPTGRSGVRARGAAAARGGLDAVGLVRSPFVIDGRQPLFAEPPHMQASMLFLPSGSRPPEVGSEIEARVRFTATIFDRVEIS